MSRNGIWTSPNSFREFSDSRRDELLVEVATRQAAGLDLHGLMGILPDPDPVLQKRGGGVDVLRELRADDKVLSSIQSRKLGTLKKQNFELAPGHAKGEEPTEEAVRLCKELEKDLEAIDLYNLFSQILDAPYFGFTPVEIIWEPSRSFLKVADLRPRPSEWFEWTDRHELVFISYENIERQPVPANKFVVARHFPEASNPYGLRLLSACIWPVTFKKGGLQFWLTLCEKFGIPWTIAEAGTNASDKDIQNMKAMLASMVQDAVAVLKGGSKVQIHGIDGKGSDMHRALVRDMNSSIAQIIMGQTLTADVQDKGALAASRTHGEILQDFREADERLIVSTMNDLAWIYTQVNGLPDTFSPTFKYVEPEDYSALADLDLKIRKLGPVFKPVHFTRHYNMSEDEFEMPDTGSKESAAFAEFADADDVQDAIDAWLNEIMPEAAKASGQLNAEILAAIDKAESFDDLQLLLAELLGDKAATDELEDLAGRVMLNAGLFGQHSAGTETQDD